MKLQEVIQQQIDAGNFYTRAQVDEFFGSKKWRLINKFIDEGSVLFHVAETNDQAIGGKVGDYAWCNKYVFAASINGEWKTDDELDRIWSLKAFL